MLVILLSLVACTDALASDRNDSASGGGSRVHTSGIMDCAETDVEVDVPSGSLWMVYEEGAIGWSKTKSREGDGVVIVRCDSPGATFEVRWVE